MSVKHWFVYCFVFSVALAVTLLFLLGKILHKNSLPNENKPVAIEFHNPPATEKSEEDLLAEKELKKMEEEMKPKFHSLMSAMQRMRSENKTPNDGCMKVMQLVMSSNQLMQGAQMSGSNKYKLRGMEIVRDMINEAYEEAKSAGLISETREQNES